MERGGMRTRRLLAFTGALLIAMPLLAACGAQASGGSGGGSSVATLTATPMSSATSSPGSSPTSSPGSSGTMLSCVTVSGIQGVDVISTVLTCKVTHAPAGDTSFTLTYAVKSSTGTTHEYTPACSGALSHGSGSCSERYNSVAPNGIGDGTVTGKTEPDQRPLGPVIPQQQSAPSSGPTPSTGLN